MEDMILFLKKIIIEKIILLAEPNNALYNSNNHSKKIIYNFKNKYNYLQNKYRVNPLDYSNYLLDNLQDNISHHYNV